MDGGLLTVYLTPTAYVLLATCLNDMYRKQILVLDWQYYLNYF